MPWSRRGNVSGAARMGDVAASEQHLNEHPLSGSSLARHDVLYAVTHLLQQDTSRVVDGQPLRLIAVLLVLYTEEAFEHKQERVLGLRQRAFFALLQEALRTHFGDLRLELQRLIEAVAEVDTTSTTTRMVQSRELLSMCTSDDSSVGILQELPSSSKLARLHRSLDAPADEADNEASPLVSSLSRLFVKAIMCAGLFMTVFKSSYESRMGAGVIACATACIALLWHSDARQRWLVMPSTSTALKACCAYILVLILTESMLPPSTVAMHARERFERVPIAMASVYGVLGAFLSLQPDWPSMLGCIALLFLRVIQLVTCDARPKELFSLCLRYSIAPFVGGYLMTQPSVLIGQRLWRELRQARSQTQTANVEAARVRSHAWAVEAARREQLTSMLRTGAPPPKRPGSGLPFLTEMADSSTTLALLRAMQVEASHGMWGSLATRTVYARESLCAGTALLLLCAHSWGPHGLGRAIFASCALSVAMLSLASLFPIDFHSRVARRYLLSLVLTMAAVGPCVNLRHHFYQLTVDAPTRTAHALLCAGVVCAGADSVRACLAGGYTWARVRGYLLLDGLMHSVTTLVMRSLSHDAEDDIYPPGGMSLVAAGVRALCPLVLGCALTASARSQIKVLSDVTGVVPPSVAVTQLVDGAALGVGVQLGAPTASDPMLTASTTQAVKRQRVMRLTFGRSFCVLCATLFFATWPPLAPALVIRPSLLLGLCFSAAALVSACNFPEELHSQEGRSFLLPAAFVCAIFTAMESTQLLFRIRTQQVNAACTLVHALHALAVNVNWSNFLLQVARGSGTWRFARAVLVVDGATFLTSAITMRLLGPPSAYLPRNVSSIEAIERGLLPLLFSALLGPANRHRVVACANKLGLNHVTVHLEEMVEEMGMFVSSSSAAAAGSPPPKPGDSFRSRNSRNQPAASAPPMVMALVHRACARKAPAEMGRGVATPTGPAEPSHFPTAATALAGNALSDDDVRWITGKLHERGRDPPDRRVWPGDDPLRLAAVLLVLFAEECLLHRRPCALGVSMEECYSLLQDLVQSCAISQNDLMEAVKRVDTEGSATHLVHSHVIGAVGLWDGTDATAVDRPEPKARMPTGRPARHTALDTAALDTAALDTAALDTTDSGAIATFTAWYLPKVRALQLLLAVGVIICLATVLVDDEQQYALFCSMAACLFTILVLLSSSAQWPRLALPRKAMAFLPPPVVVIPFYLLCLILYSSTLPPETVAAKARSRLSRYSLHSAASYFGAGCFTSLQPTATRVQLVGKSATLAMLFLRGIQISAADERPFEMLRIGTMAATLPFVCGYLFMQQQEELMRRMWQEIRFAEHEAQNTNAHTAAERHRAWALEMARREMLVARATARTRKQRRRNAAAGPRATSVDADSLPEDSVVQEDGYWSPGEASEHRPISP